MKNTGALRAAKAAGTFILVGLSLCIAGWFLSGIVPLLAFFLWLFGVPITILAIPVGTVVWLGSRRETDD